MYHLYQGSFGSSAFHCRVEMSGLHRIQFLNLEIPADRLLARHGKALAAQPQGLHSQMLGPARAKTSSAAAAASKDHPSEGRFAMSASSAAGCQTNEQQQLSKVVSPPGNIENSSTCSEQIKIRFWI